MVFFIEVIGLPSSRVAVSSLLARVEGGVAVSSLLARIEGGVVVSSLLARIEGGVAVLVDVSGLSLDLS